MKRFLIINLEYEVGVSGSGITSLNAQIFAKSSKKEFENRTPRSTQREVREDFSFFCVVGLWCV